ncbi:MBOAT family O-acyltransferase [Leptospira yasudae]|uniref:Membrane-bound O-acyltransferase family protein n=1 Tax=Leptospira yasudae TaxID=2202201 RepID=A0ABX9LZG8_9LEPT|nr:MBOAT family O-acyltransferase [Leptospira yasudae]RHX78286.1 membrane-bound O-acyltransferase family protein [Leptospira yasudae]
MKFNSLEFVFIFFPLFVFFFFFIAKIINEKFALIFLILGSLVFYGFWNLPDIRILFLSLIINYTIGYFLIYGSLVKSTRKIFYLIGLLFNLGILFYFKYSTYMLENLSHWFHSISWHSLTLPLALSFITFQQIAFLAGSYDRKVENFSFLRYFGLVTFFPHLIAGPIVLHNDLLPQFAEKDRYVFQIDNFYAGLYRFGLGLGKKVIIADSVSPLVQYYFDSAEVQVLGLSVWIGIVAYAIQLYFDFSGYSDMAIGIAKTINMDLPINFASPYKSMSIVEFWRRWHISLSNFLKKYLYIPLGGNQFGLFQKYRNLIITMSLGGIWHGAGINFFLWGFIHGTFLIINHEWSRQNLLQQFRSNTLYKFLSYTLTMFCVLVAWVPFRAKDFITTLNLYKAAFGFYGFGFESLRSVRRSYLRIFSDDIFGGNALLVLFLSIFIVLFFPNTNELMEKRSWTESSFYKVFAGIVLAFSILSMQKNSTFLYFVF